MSPAEGSARIAVLSDGFRPFFLGSSVWAGTAMPFWLGLMMGRLDFVRSRRLARP